MDFYAILDQVVDLLRQRQRVTYRALKVQFQLDDEALEALKEELIEAQHLAADETGRILVWIGDSGTMPLATAVPASTQDRAPLAYTPSYLAEKILTSRSALEGERKQVTVLFADLKDSTELIRGLDPEAAQQLLDPAIHHMMDAVHRFEGTVNQVLADRNTVALYIRRLGDRGFIEISEHDGAERTWYTAAERLGSTGASAIPALMERLEAGDDYERMLAIYALVLATQDPRVMARTGGEYVSPGPVLKGSDVDHGAAVARAWWARHGHFWAAVPSRTGISAPAPPASFDTLRPAPRR